MDDEPEIIPQVGRHILLQYSLDVCQVQVITVNEEALDTMVMFYTVNKILWPLNKVQLTHSICKDRCIGMQFRQLPESRFLSGLPDENNAICSRIQYA